MQLIDPIWKNAPEGSLVVLHTEADASLRFDQFAQARVTEELSQLRVIVALDDKIVLTCLIPLAQVNAQQLLFSGCRYHPVTRQKSFFLCEVGSEIGNCVERSHHNVKCRVIKDVNITFVRVNLSDREGKS